MKSYTQAVGVDMYNQSITGDVAKTLNSIKSDSDHTPCVVTFEPGIASRDGGHVYENVSGTLRAEMHGNLPCVCSAGFKPWQGAKAKGVGYEKEKCPTLLAGQEPAVCISFEPGIASRDGGHVYENISGTLRATPGDNQMTVAFTTEMAPKADTKGKAFSLRERDYKDPQAVVLENHPNDSRVKIDDSGTVQTLTSRCGTGGGNVPMVLEPVCFQQNQREEVRIMDVLGAITAESGMHNTNYVVFSKIRRAKTADDFETWGETGVCNTLNTFDNGDVRTNECVICLQGNGIDRADTAGCNGKGWTEDVSYTLNTIDRHAVAYCMETFHCNTEEEKTPPIKARDYKDPLVICYEKTKK